MSNILPCDDIEHFPDYNEDSLGDSSELQDSEPFPLALPTTQPDFNLGEEFFNQSQVSNTNVSLRLRMLGISSEEQEFFSLPLGYESQNTEDEYLSLPSNNNSSLISQTISESDGRSRNNTQSFQAESSDTDSDMESESDENESEISDYQPEVRRGKVRRSRYSQPTGQLRTTSTSITVTSQSSVSMVTQPRGNSINSRSVSAPRNYFDDRPCTKWFITINKKNNRKVMDWYDSCKREISKILYSKEIGQQTGRIHYHLAVVLHNPVKIRYWETQLGVDNHFEHMKGSWQQAKLYASKDGNIIISYEDLKGDKDKIPSKTEEFFKKLIDSPTYTTLRRLLIQYPMMTLHLRAAKELISLFSVPSRLPTHREIIFLYGKPGEGKTRLAMSMIGNEEFSRTNIFGEFLTGYMQTDIVLFDDLNLSSSLFPKEIFFQLLSEYDFPMNVKHGDLLWFPKKIIITRVEHSDEFTRFGWTDAEIVQFNRRVTQCLRCYKEDDEYRTENVELRKTLRPTVNNNQIISN